MHERADRSDGTSSLRNCFPRVSGELFLKAAESAVLLPQSAQHALQIVSGRRRAVSINDSDGTRILLGQNIIAR